MDGRKPEKYVAESNDPNNSHITDKILALNFRNLETEKYMIYASKARAGETRVGARYLKRPASREQ
jgi:hypothetical protein